MFFWGRFGSRGCAGSPAELQVCVRSDGIGSGRQDACFRMGGSESGEEESKDKVSFPAIVSGEGVERNRDQLKTSPCP